MVKRELFKKDYDSFDEMPDEDFKSPKKAKMGAKAESVSPGNKRKRAHPGAAKRTEWTKEEEEALMDCVGELVTAGLNQGMKNYPILAARKQNGCTNHWNSWRRMLETMLLGAPTVDSNGKKLPKAKEEGAKKEEVKMDK